MKLRSFIYPFSLLAAALLLSGCGNDRQLQSIMVSPSSMTAAHNAQVTFTASGQFNMAPMSVTPLRVSWMEFGPGIDQVSTADNYTLTDQPFTTTCFVPGTFTVVALAPIDPGASPSGSVPQQAFNDLVSGHAMAEGGFVAAIATVTCQ
jgi:hypothetical protein